ncbi:MAG: iron-sulfur cluster carrier protein ApbC [Acidobacteriota bacterium]|nr:iron-sulfur cluster carrier protein ApbC [Blastocatellia bacterium]MDW8413267.1 iron-sulfur cluster carrier protein ApbC [Acidobacteriota bacterium]
MDKQAILEALREVKYPQLTGKKNIVEAKLVREVKVCGGIVAVEIVLPAPADEGRKRLQEAVQEAVAKLPGVEQVEVKIDLEVVRGRPGSEAGLLAEVKNIIAVSSGKGGVGKSTVAVNIAVALAEMGASVGLLDTDIYGPNVPIMLGQIEEPRIRGNKIAPREAYRVKFMSVGLLNRGDQAVVWRGPMLHRLIEQFLRDVDWGKLDYLIVDMPPGTGDVQLSLAQLVPVTAAILVTTPQEVALADVRKAYNMFQQVGIPVIGIVENMSYFVCSNCSERHEIFGAGGGADLAQRYSIALLAKIPLSVSIREGGDLGVPVVSAAPDSPQAAAFRQAAEVLAAKLSEQALRAARLPILNFGG